MLITPSKPIAASLTVTTLLKEECRWFKRRPRLQEASAVVGWGMKTSGQRAQEWARKLQVPCWRLEDGFLRSYMPGAAAVGLSLVVDEQGIYYDATRPSTLENLLASETDLLAGIDADILRAMALINEHELSKYNHAPALDESLLREEDQARVLVVDQTFGDVSVALGGAEEATFDAMVSAALDENPLATVYIKTHPEVSNGAKQGYLSDWPAHPRVVMLQEAINPVSLVKRMDRVYVVTSTLGFEALLAGVPASVFGLPWYAGWGVTDDRQRCERRTRQRSVKELFAAAYWHYSRYLNPETHEPGTLFDVIAWLVRQKEIASRMPGRQVAVGFNDWKAANLGPLISGNPQQLVFVRSAEEAEKLNIEQGDNLLAWGRDAPSGMDALAAEKGVKRWRIEDGFIRSVGLGAHMVAPRSLVLDVEGIYFDPSQPSTLEHMLTTLECTQEELACAGRVRRLIVEQGLTKYNVEPRLKPCWAGQPREVVFVPGQVEDDASIRYGATAINTNLGLLKAARNAHPEAFIVYKPHPDVVYAKRLGNLAEAKQWADAIETRCSVVSCLEYCDVVHTMTSLTGFDALLRNKHVVTYGEPFYACWGLTEDMAEGPALLRRHRRLSLDELVVGALLRYPRYWDPVMKGFTTCEAVVYQIIAERTALEREGKLGNRKLGYWRRKWRKWKILASKKMKASQDW
ncbi:capsular polysaccharide biosynthesis protein [Halomonas sp. MC140]|nr:capsular polysaccharide biosynthesis protein [Halomonas sp. MC140]MDN7131958.1 capsular polysaccharide biosynthesis protein [Halomonas sp. MC140]